MRLAQLVLRHTGLGDDADVAELVGGQVDDALRLGQRELHDGRAERAVRGAELRDADELVLLGLPAASAR